MSDSNLRNVVTIGFALAVMVLWEFCPRLGLVDIGLLPPLSVTIATLSRLIGDGTLVSAAGVTFGEILVAWAIVIPLGVICGLTLATQPWATRLLGPFFKLFLSIPKSIFLPFFILTLGIGFWQKVFFGVFQAIFYVSLATAAATHAVPRPLDMLAHSLGASRLQRYRAIYMPAMLPYVLDALRVGLSFIATGVIFAEIYVSQRGLGHLIGSWAESFEIDKLYAALLLTALLCIVLNEALRALERRMSIWRET